VKLSVVVPMYHAYFFDDIVASYAWQAANKEDYEVIFMLTGKNSSPLGATLARVSTEKMLPWKTQVVAGMSNCHSRNAATKIAAGDTVLFIDGDQIIAPHLFQKHIEAHAASDNMVGLGICNINVERHTKDMEVWIPYMSCQKPALPDKQRIDSPDCLKFVRTMALSQAIGHAWWHNMNNLTDYVNVVGRNVSVNRRRFIEMGMWDEEFAYAEVTQSRGWEDTEFALRAFRAGLQFVMVPSWTVHLEHPRMGKDGGLENAVKLARKHRWFFDSRPDWWQTRYSREQIGRML